MTRGSGSIRQWLAMTVGAAALLAMPSAMAAGKTAEDGWAHRSAPTQTVDGWAARSSQAPVTDGFQMARLVLPQATQITDGFEVSQIQLPQSSGVPHGFEVALVEIPKSQSIEDGWAVRSELTRRPAPAIDGWSYGALTSESPRVAIEPGPAPRRAPSSAPYELVAIALALAALASGGAALSYRRHHHLPV